MGRAIVVIDSALFYGLTVEGRRVRGRCGAAGTDRQCRQKLVRFSYCVTKHVVFFFPLLET